MVTSVTTSLVLLTVLGFLALLLQARQTLQEVCEKQWTGRRHLQRQHAVSVRQRSQRWLDDVAPQLSHEPRTTTTTTTALSTGEIKYIMLTHEMINQINDGGCHTTTTTTHMM